MGNPDLKPEFTHVIKANYDHYMPSRRFNLSLGLDAFAIENKVATNILQVLQPLVVDPDDPTQNKYSSINEIHYVNLSGSKGLIGRYSVTQQLDERRYNLSLIGELMYRRSPAMSNGLRYQNAHWRFTQRMASRMSPTDNIEINPFVEFGINKMSIASLHAPSTTLKTLRIVVDGKMHFLKTFQINYRVSKNYISGISEYNTNPFVFDAGFEKQFLPRRNLVMTLNIYDLFHQNNFINQMVTPHGVINTESNALSRYFLIGLRLNLQKWSGTPTRKGEAMKRRGDGSFIY